MKLHYVRSRGNHALIQSHRVDRSDTGCCWLIKKKFVPCTARKKSSRKHGFFIR